MDKGTDLGLGEGLCCRSRNAMVTVSHEKTDNFLNGRVRARELTEFRTNSICLNLKIFPPTFRRRPFALSVLISPPGGLTLGNLDVENTTVDFLPSSAIQALPSEFEMKYITLLSTALLGVESISALIPRPMVVHRSPWAISRVVPRPYVFLASPLRASPDPFQLVDKSRMEEIIQDVEDTEQASSFVVLDVRNPPEVQETGPLSESSVNLPLSLIVQDKVLALGNAEFESACGFPKPSPSDTLVFSCKAGKRAEQAAVQASQDGYEKVLVYGGSANEWFA